MMSRTLFYLKTFFIIYRYRRRIRRQPFIKRIINKRLTKKGYHLLLLIIETYLSRSLSSNTIVLGRLSDDQKELRQYFVEHQDSEQSLVEFIKADLKQLRGRGELNFSVDQFPEIQLLLCYTEYVVSHLPLICVFAEGIVAKIIMVDYASMIISSVEKYSRDIPTTFFTELIRTEAIELEKTKSLFNKVSIDAGTADLFLTTTRMVFELYILLLSRLEDSSAKF